MLSYKSLLGRVDDLVGQLNQLGVGKGNRVAIVLPNGPEMALAFLGVATAATAAPLNPGYGSKEFSFYLSDMGADLLLLQQGTAPAAKEAAAELGIPVLELIPEPESPAGVFSLEGSALGPARDAALSSENDVALILHTSGTTSRPKMVPLTQKNLCVSADNIRQSLELGQADRCLNVMPLFHIHGLVGALLSSLFSGGSVVCSPGFNAEAFPGWLREFAPSWYTAVPTMHQALLARATSEGLSREDHSLRFIRSCSSALSPALMKGLEERFGVPVVEAYGMTEASHQMSVNPLPPAERKPGSVGLPARVEVAIMDAQGSFLSQGTEGEIVIKGDNVTAGYENNPEANRENFTAGWFRTGDLGFLDPDGYLFISGRKKELVNRGGEKIAPREIDELLQEHPAVLQAVAFALPHPTLGEDLAAAVVLQEGASVDEEELREFAGSRLAAHKIPSRILVVDAIPKGPTGKLQRIGLHKALADRLAVDYQAPEGELESLLATLWAELLDLEQVGAKDHFITLGGDSLRGTQLVARLAAALEMELPADLVFRAPVLEAQASLVEELLLDQLENMSEDEARTLLQDEQDGESS